MWISVSISSNIARGAAYALGSEIPTLQQYLDEGAGFGLIKEYRDEGETHFNVPKLLLHKKVRRSSSFLLRGMSGLGGGLSIDLEFTRPP
jgi:hypothetical protein